MKYLSPLLTAIIGGIIFGLISFVLGYVFAQYIGFKIVGFEETACELSSRAWGLLGVSFGSFLGYLAGWKIQKLKERSFRSKG